MVAIGRKPLRLSALALGPKVREKAPELADPRHFQRLVEEHAPYVWRVLRSLGVRENDLDDVSQETFLIVHRQLHTFEGRGQLRSWIYGIAIRVASDQRNKAYRRHELSTAEPPMPSLPATQENHVARRQGVLLLDSVLAELTPERRQVFVLYEVEELCMREVAEIVGCPLTTAYSRYQAARECIAAKLAEAEEKDGAT